MLQLLSNVGCWGTFPGGRITAGGAEKSQQCHNYFLHFSKFAFERPQVRMWGRHLTSLTSLLLGRVALPRINLMVF